MKNQVTRILQSAAIGAATGGITSSLIAYTISNAGICNYIPPYFDKVLASSGELTKGKLADFTARHGLAIKESLMTSTGVMQNIFQDTKIASAAGYMANFVQYASNALPPASQAVSTAARLASYFNPVSNMLLSEFSNAVYVFTTGVVKESLVHTCADILDISIPKALLVGLTVGAGLGVLYDTCLARPKLERVQASKAESSNPATSRKAEWSAFKSAQTFFNKKMHSAHYKETLRKNHKRHDPELVCDWPEYSTRTQLTAFQNG